MLRGLILLLMVSITVGSTEAASLSQDNLKEVAVFKTSEPHSAEFYRDYLFIADGNSLLVYNTSDPENPKQITRFTDFNDPGRVYGLSISGQYLYIATGPGWISVVNISDPENPKRMYDLNYLDNANDVAVNGDYIYVADANTGMLIFNLTDRMNPELIGTFYVLKSNISGFFQGWGGISVAVSGKYAYLSGAERKGFYIIDVSDPVNPQEVYHSIGKVVYDIAISRDLLYLARADGTSQFDILDISNPYLPKNIDNITIPDTADRSAIAIHQPGDYIYVASGDTWHVFRMPDTFPPDIMINNPKEGEILTSNEINVSGKAFDRSGVKEVLVNGKFAGTESWNQIITLVEGANNIIITASDKNGNNLTATLQVIYRPPVQPNITTPEQTVSVATPKIAVEKIAILKSPLFYGAVFVLLIILAYWIWVHKIKR